MDYTAIIYTDGSSRGNPGPGGWAAVIKLKNEKIELDEGYRCTTNNRMELMAAIKALQYFDYKQIILLYSDSRYLVNAVEEGWLNTWRLNGWKLADKKKVKNIDLWNQLIPLLEKHTVKFEWIKSHSGYPLNERCNFLAQKAADNPTLIDYGYKTNNVSTKQTELL